MKNIMRSHRLVPVTLSGVIVPRDSEFGLACVNGVEYAIVTDDQWRSVLSHYCWKDVRFKGLLNPSKMTVVPQRIFPKGPTGERECAVNLATLMGRIAEWVLVPAAVFAVMS